MIIGLTGGIATGKSVVGKVFQGLGAELIDADELGHEVMEPDRPAWKKIVKVFGPEILEKNKAINRKKLGALVFADKKLRKRLEKIVHPEIFKETDKIIARIQNEDPWKMIVINAPLLIEADMNLKMDRVIVVYCDREIQLKRLIRRDKISVKAALQKIDSQMSLDEKLKYADFVIDNNRTKKEAKVQAEVIFEKLMS